MTRRLRTVAVPLSVSVFVSAMTVVATVTLHASVPVGVYAIVDKVVFEPEGEAQRIQVWGTFSTWEDGTGAGYKAPARGYLYYTCPREQAAICRNEWADLKSTAGTGQVIGFGSRSLLAGRVRPTSEKTSAPDVYPIQFGVMRMGTSPRGAVFDQLKAHARAR